MRLIGHMAAELNAQLFSDYLLVRGIENNVELEKDSGWALWVIDEDKLAEATELLAAYKANPNNPEYAAKARDASELRARKEKDEAAYRKKVRDRANLFPTLQAYGLGPVTLSLIIISVIVFLWSGFGTRLQSVLWLFITAYTQSGLAEVRNGEVWRLLTPIFIHFDPLHIIFNLFWLRDLGSMIEARQGSLLLIALTVVIGVGSNVGQYLVGGPVFGGMSGVVYGLLGYIWLRGKFDPGSGLFLHPTTVTTAMVWFVLCYTGLFGHVANTAHAAGLVIGVAWGFLSSLRSR